VSAPLQKQLNAETAAAARAHLPIKVALIASPVDLGVIPQLFGQPEQYANFLDQEISYPTPQPLLVVMGAGYGTQGLPPAAQAAVASLPPPAGRSSDALAQAALRAVRTLARADGRRLAADGGSGGRGGTTTYIVIALAVAAAGTAAALVAARRRAGGRRRLRP
jgi:hypothetical protein